MGAEVKGPLNLNAFLKMFEDKLNGKTKIYFYYQYVVIRDVCLILGTDEENILLEAFKLFDEKGVGALPKDL